MEEIKLNGQYKKEVERSAKEVGGLEDKFLQALMRVNEITRLQITRL